jgi:hypothetical protein
MVELPYNWITAAGLGQMLANGWTEQGRRPAAAGRILVTLRDDASGCDIYRSLAKPAEDDLDREVTRGDGRARG